MFNRVKVALSAAIAMPYFAPLKETMIIVDASPASIAGILVQDEQPIAFDSCAVKLRLDIHRPSVPIAITLEEVQAVTTEKQGTSNCH